MPRVSLLRTQTRKKQRRHKHETWCPHLGLQSKTKSVMNQVLLLGAGLDARRSSALYHLSVGCAPCDPPSGLVRGGGSVGERRRLSSVRSSLEAHPGRWSGSGRCEMQFQTTLARGSSGALVRRRAVQTHFRTIFSEIRPGRWSGGGQKNFSARAGSACTARTGQLPPREIAREERSRCRKAGDKRVVDGAGR